MVAFQNPLASGMQTNCPLQSVFSSRSATAMMEQEFEENLAEQVEVSSAADTFISSYLTNDAFGTDV